MVEEDTFGLILQQIQTVDIDLPVILVLEQLCSCIFLEKGRLQPCYYNSVWTVWEYECVCNFFWKQVHFGSEIQFWKSFVPVVCLKEHLSLAWLEATVMKNCQIRKYSRVQWGWILLHICTLFRQCMDGVIQNSPFTPPGSQSAVWQTHAIWLLFSSC